jgi:hypothetical protein
MTNNIKDLQAVREALIDRIIVWNGDSIDMLKSSAVELIRAALTPPSSEQPVPVAEVERVAAMVDPQAFIGTEEDIHSYCSPCRVDYVQEKAINKARMIVAALESKTEQPTIRVLKQAADPRLTKAQCLIDEARSLVADYVDETTVSDNQ